MSKLLEIVAGLIGLLLSLKKKKEHEEAQSEADHASDNPADWFANHFGVSDGVTSRDKGEAAEADADGSVRSGR